MSSLNFIGGEKGGVGKSVVSRVLAQYFIDKERTFVGFDTDRSHTSFTRFYADYASPVIVDSYEGLDAIATAFETTGADGAPVRVIVDLAAQTAAPLTRWIKDSELFAVLADMGIMVNFWHVADAGKDSVELLGRLVNTFEDGPITSSSKTMAGAQISLNLTHLPHCKKRCRWVQKWLSWRSFTRPVCARLTSRTPAFGRR